MDSIGTIVIAMGNDDVLGEYTCTPYNQLRHPGGVRPHPRHFKGPPQVSHQACPSVPAGGGPGTEHQLHGHRAAEARINWTKEGDTRPRQFQVLEDGTLFFRSIRKEHHGTWVCKARDNLTEISTSTTVWVTGTSPHAVTNLTVRPDVFAVNVSWEPGFDGGHPQQFTVWFRQTSHGPHDWIIHMVPDGDHRLSVDHLWPNTSYQFSVLAQSDRGSGPFSQIINTHTLCVPTATATPRRPPAPSERARPLLPPSNLAANRTAGGIVLRWAPPPAPSLLPLAYVLEYRGGPGAWEVLHSAIPAQQDRLLLTGLVKVRGHGFVGWHCGRGGREGKRGGRSGRG
ncbi:protein turtle homolog A-like [Chiloscyllium punctatum]|uniref:protein turtle homolog A-like n=1 Tax=Chiloscyllium punctatum TaxID=137246 RepID=UPI003B63EE8F